MSANVSINRKRNIKLHIRVSHKCGSFAGDSVLRPSPNTETACSAKYFDVKDVTWKVQLTTPAAVLYVLKHLIRDEYRRVRTIYRVRQKVFYKI